MKIHVLKNFYNNNIDRSLFVLVKVVGPAKLYLLLLCLICLLSHFWEENIF